MPKIRLLPGPPRLPALIQPAQPGKAGWGGAWSLVRNQSPRPKKGCLRSLVRPEPKANGATDRIGTSPRTSSPRSPRLLKGPADMAVRVGFLAVCCRCPHRIEMLKRHKMFIYHLNEYVRTGRKLCIYFCIYALRNSLDPFFCKKTPP